MFDCHVHSHFSGDCEQYAAEQCEAARTAGLDGICFTDHLDIGYPDDDNIFTIDFPIFIEHMKALQAQYAPWPVCIGVEVGDQARVRDQIIAQLAPLPLDFILLSRHVINGVDPYNGQYFENQSREKAYSSYLKACLASVRDFPDYDAFAHIGYATRYAPYPIHERAFNQLDAPDLINAILGTLVTQQKALEINTSALAETGDFLPARFIVERYYALGGRLITIGSDAHHAQHVGRHFERARKQLLEIGFQSAVYYQNRRAIPYSL